MDVGQSINICCYFSIVSGILFGFFSCLYTLLYLSYILYGGGDSDENPPLLVSVTIKMLILLLVVAGSTNQKPSWRVVIQCVAQPEPVARQPVVCVSLQGHILASFPDKLDLEKYTLTWNLASPVHLVQGFGSRTQYMVLHPSPCATVPFHDISTMQDSEDKILENNPFV